MRFMESVRAWLRTCPLIDRKNRFNVGYLGIGTDYSLSMAGSTHKQDILGYAQDHYSLLFQARLPYGAAIEANLTAAELFEELTAWLRAQEKAHSYPQLQGCSVTALSVANSGMILRADSNTADYQLQIQIDTEEV